MFRSLVLASLILTAQPVLAQSQNLNQADSPESIVVNNTKTDEIIIKNTIDPLQEKSGKIKLILVLDPSAKTKSPEVQNIKKEVKNTPVVKDTKENVKKEVLKSKEETKKSEVAITTKNTTPVLEKNIIKNTAPEAEKPNKGNTIIFENSATAVPKVAEIKTEAPTSTKTETKISEAEIKDFIKKYSQKYNVDESDLLRIAECESGFKADLVGSGKYYGIFQFSKPTFNEFVSQLDITDPNPLNPDHNIEVASYMMANGQSWRWGCK